MSRSEIQTAERAKFRLLTPCDPEVYEDCAEHHHTLEDGTRVDVTDYGVCEVFKDNATSEVRWYVPYDRRAIETWPGTDIVALNQAGLS